MDLNRKYLEVVVTQKWKDRADAQRPANYISGRQTDLADAYLEVVAEYGPFDQGFGPDGCNYDHGNTLDEQGISCEHCIFYSTGTCEIVSGDIDPHGLCDHHIVPSEVSDDAKLWQPNKKKKMKKMKPTY